MSKIIRSSRTQPAIITVLIVGLLILSGFTWTLYTNNREALKTKNAEINTLNQRIRTLSILEELANLTKPPQPLGAGDGTQIVKSYPMEFDYNYPNYDMRRTIITLYIPINGSTASLDLFIDPFSSPNRYPLNITLQKGDAWDNQTWVRLGTLAELYDYNSSTVVWQAPVIWSLNTSESGLYITPQLSEGWYTLSMFGPVQNMGTPHPIHALHDVAKIDSYRFIIVVTVLSDDVQGFFVASNDSGIVRR